MSGEELAALVVVLRMRSKVPREPEEQRSKWKTAAREQICETFQRSVNALVR